MTPLFRWTIGKTTPNGLDCLELSIRSFLEFYQGDVVICHNCDPENLQTIVARLPVQLVDQRGDYDVAPKEVAWKLYPPRLDMQRKEIVIDNDIVFVRRVAAIDQFLNDDCTLLLEGMARNYGRFDCRVPEGYVINSGIYGMPPEFDLADYITAFMGPGKPMGSEWSHRFDEQGLVATALLSYRKHVIIPASSVVNCEFTYEGEGDAFHFIGLNRRETHRPYLKFKDSFR